MGKEFEDTVNKSKSLCGVELDAFCRMLDGMQIGRIGINRSTAMDDCWLTLYAKDNDGEMDEQLTFSPDDLLKFCRRIVDVANKAATKSKNKEQKS